MANMSRHVTHYTILQVDSTVEQAEIKRAYRRLVKRYHPDCNHHDNPDVLHDRIAAINAAYEVLGNPHARASYDRSIGVMRQAPSGDAGGAAARATAQVKQRRAAGLSEDARLDQWMRQVYEPVTRAIDDILSGLDDRLDDLSADPYDDDLMADFLDYLAACRELFARAQVLFRGCPNPPSLASVAELLYHCLNQLGDGIEELGYFALNYDEYHLHTGQELWRIAIEFRERAGEAIASPLRSRCC